MNTIYILDFDADIAFALCKWFNAHGVEAKAFSTLEQLLKQLGTRHPNCIILDSLFGRVSLTIDICHTIRHVSNYSGKILLTSTTNLSATDLQACSATGFIAKPFELLKVLDVVKQPIKETLALNAV